jgi:hypothetical protein
MRPMNCETWDGYLHCVSIPIINEHASRYADVKAAVQRRLPKNNSHGTGIIDDESSYLEAKEKARAAASAKGGQCSTSSKIHAAKLHKANIDKRAVRSDRLE